MRLLLLLMFVCGVQIIESTHAHAETTETTLAEILARAFTESPLVRQISAKTSAQRASGNQTEILENPVLDSEVRIPVSYREARGSDEVTIALSQPLRMSDFGVRQKVNQLIQSAATTDNKVEMLAFSQSVTLAYVKAWALERRTHEMKSYLEKASAVGRAIQSATQAGLLGTGEGLLFKAESDKARYQLGAMSADLLRARAELSRIAGFPVRQRLAKPPFVTLPTDEALFSAERLLPAQARSALAVKLAREQQRLARADAYPRFAPRLVYERNSDYTDYVGVGISIELPLFDRKQIDREVRAQEFAAAESIEKYFSGDGYQVEVRALRDSVVATAALVAGYENEVIPSLKSALEIEEDLFAAGKGAPIRVWQSLRELSQTQGELIEHTVRLYTHRTELVTLTGMDF